MFWGPYYQRTEPVFLKFAKFEVLTAAMLISGVARCSETRCEELHWPPLIEISKLKQARLNSFVQEEQFDA
jgi:hypothetical protein